MELPNIGSVRAMYSHPMEPELPVLIAKVIYSTQVVIEWVELATNNLAILLFLNYKTFCRSIV
jgi:hypothetical protein